MNTFILFHNPTIVVKNPAVSYSKKRCINCAKTRKGCDKKDPCSGCRYSKIECIYRDGIGNQIPDTTKEKSVKRKRLGQESRNNNVEKEHDVICGRTLWNELMRVDAIKFPQNDNQTPLHWAAQNGLIMVTRLLLLDLQLDATAQNFSGPTPLHLAQENGHTEVVKLLRESGACVNKEISDVNMLHLSKNNKHIEVVGLPTHELGAKSDVAISEKELERPDTATSLENQASHIRGNRPPAISEKVLGAERPNTKLLDKANSYYKQSKYDEAESLYQQALAKCEKDLGKEHPDTVTSLNNLATVYHNQRKYIEAELLYQRALATYEKVLGLEHTSTAVILNNLAKLYYSQCKYDEVKLLYQHALNTPKSLKNLAHLYYSPQTLYKEALEIHEKMSGSDHKDTANSLNKLAMLYCRQGKFDVAELLYQQALASNEKVFGLDHPSTPKSLNNLANLYYIQKRYDKAESLYQRALAIRVKMLGIEHPDTANSLDNLATNYTKQHKYDVAERLYRRALEIHQKVLGPEHPHIASSLTIQAFLYETWQKYDVAKSLYEKALEIRRMVLGEQHPDTITSLQNLANLIYISGVMKRV